MHDSSQRHRLYGRLCYLLISLSALTLAACGGCPKAQRAWDRAQSAPKKIRSGPHWMLEVQPQEVTRRLAPAKGRVNKSKSKLKLDTPVGVKIPIRFKLNDFKWVIDGESGVLRVVVGVLIKGEEILKINLRGASPLQLDRKAKKLRLTLRADQFKRADMQLGDDARKALRKAIRKQIPKELRRLVPKKKLMKLVNRALKLINDKGYPVIRKELLTPLGTLVKLAWDLPDYPIERVGIEVTEEAWRLGLWSTIRADGLGSKAMRHGLERGAKVSAGARIYISTPWVAAAGNWAMKTGKMPARFNRKGEPSKKGSARAALTWRSGPRPLKVHFWSGAQSKLSLCLYARAGVDPNLGVKGGKLIVNAKGKLERVEGNPIAKTAVRLSGIGERTLQWHHKASAPAQMSVGDSKNPLKWLNVELSARYLRVGVDLGDRSISTSAPQTPLRARLANLTRGVDLSCSSPHSDLPTRLHLESHRSGRCNPENLLQAP